MNLPKAIEILDDCTKGALLGISEDTKDSIKLGIEALKAIQCGREGLRTEFLTPLIGETE